VSEHVNNYDIFEGEELEIADKIQRRRLQILIHSCIYYHFDQNIISDKKYDEIGRDLVKLQNDNPSIAKKVKWSDAFEGFDASTGFDLPITDEWVLNKATRLLEVVSGRKR
jgi:hypothetical protein